MSNTLLTIDMVSKEAMRLLHNNLGFSKGVNRQYDSSFAVEGAKIGDSLRIRLPAQYYVSNGANMVTQDHTQQYANLTVDQQKHVGISFTSKEKTMDLTSFSDLVLKPAIAKLTSSIDSAGLATANQVYNSVGTPGTTPVANSTVNSFVSASKVLGRFACPNDGMRSMIVNPDAEESALINSMALFNPGAQVSQQYRKGSMSGRPVYSFDWAMDQNVEAFTTGTRANGTVLGANQTGATLDITAAGNATTFSVGDSFTIANVYSVNPENQDSTGALQQFTVTTAATMDANGANTIAITPSIVLAAANVANGTVNALPANDAALTHIGAVSTSAVVNVAHHRDAFILGMADLAKPNVGESSFARMDGMTLRVWTASDIGSDSHKTRIDVLYGWKLIRPELACKVFG